MRPCCINQLREKGEISFSSVTVGRTRMEGLVSLGGEMNQEPRFGVLASARASYDCAAYYVYV